MDFSSRLVGVLLFVCVLLLVGTNGKVMKVAWLCPEDASSTTCNSSVAALKLGLRTVEKNPNILPGFNISVKYYGTACSGQAAMMSAMMARQSYDPDVMIGPPCEEGMKVVAQLGSFWNLPVFGWSNGAVEFDGVANYPTLVRMSPPYWMLASSLVHLLIQNNWNKFTLLHDEETQWRELEEAVKREILQTAAIRILYSSHQISRNISDNDLNTILAEAKKYQKVIVFACPAVSLRRYMLAAHQLGTANGDFAFVYLDNEVHTDSSISTVVLGDSIWRRGRPDDATARHAFQSLIHVMFDPMNDKKDPTLQVPRSRFKDFGKLAKRGRKINRPLWDLPKGGDPDPRSMFLYDSLLVWSVLADRIIKGSKHGNKGGKHDKNYRNGTLVAEQARLFSAEGATGNIAINGDLDRTGKVFVLNMAATGNFRPMQVLLFNDTDQYTAVDIFPPTDGRRSKFGQGKPGIIENSTAIGAIPKGTYHPSPGFVEKRTLPLTTTTIGASIQLITTQPVAYFKEHMHVIHPRPKSSFTISSTSSFVDTTTPVVATMAPYYNPIVTTTDSPSTTTTSTPPTLLSKIPAPINTIETTVNRAGLQVGKDTMLHTNIGKIHSSVAHAGLHPVRLMDIHNQVTSKYDLTSTMAPFTTNKHPVNFNQHDHGMKSEQNVQDSNFKPQPSTFIQNVLQEKPLIIPNPPSTRPPPKQTSVKVPATVGQGGGVDPMNALVERLRALEKVMLMSLQHNHHDHPHPHHGPHIAPRIETTQPTIKTTIAPTTTTATTTPSTTKTATTTLKPVTTKSPHKLTNLDSNIKKLVFTLKDLHAVKGNNQSEIVKKLLIAALTKRRLLAKQGKTQIPTTAPTEPSTTDMYQLSTFFETSTETSTRTSKPGKSKRRNQKLGQTAITNNLIEKISSRVVNKLNQQMATELETTRNNLENGNGSNPMDAAMNEWLATSMEEMTPEMALSLRMSHGRRHLPWQSEQQPTRPPLQHAPVSRNMQGALQPLIQLLRRAGAHQLPPTTQATWSNTVNPTQGGAVWDSQFHAAPTVPWWAK